MRLIQSSKESEIQNEELPTWYVMESKGGEDWLRPSHPLTEERDIGEEQDVIMRSQPECPCGPCGIFLTVATRKESL